MMQITPQMRILVAVEAQDFRKGIDGLARICREKLEVDPFGGALFVFRNRRGTAIKLLGVRRAGLLARAETALAGALSVVADECDGGGPSGSASTPAVDHGRRPGGARCGAGVAAAILQERNHRPGQGPPGTNVSSISTSLDYPQGTEGTPVAIGLGGGVAYEVPTGKTLYVTSVVGSHTVEVDAITYGGEGKGQMFPSGTQITSTVPSGYTGLLIDADPDLLTPVLLKLDNGLNTYTVPVGATLFLRSGFGAGWALTVNGIPFRNGAGVWVIPEGATIGSLSPSVTGYTGYLTQR
jgi:hypothetical protein